MEVPLDGRFLLLGEELGYLDVTKDAMI